MGFIAKLDMGQQKVIFFDVMRLKQSPNPITIQLTLFMKYGYPFTLKMPIKHPSNCITSCNS